MADGVLLSEPVIQLEDQVQSYLVVLLVEVEVVVDWLHSVWRLAEEDVLAFEGLVNVPLDPGHNQGWFEGGSHSLVFLSLGKVLRVDLVNIVDAPCEPVLLLAFLVLLAHGRLEDLQLHFFDLLLVLIIGHNVLISLSHLGVNIVLHSLVAVQPLVFPKSFEGGPLFNLGSEETVEQPLERVGVKSLGSLFLMKAPELSKLFFSYHPVDLVAGLSAKERRRARVHDEKYNSDREQISLQAGVLA